jgi:hypothetical protein
MFGDETEYPQAAHLIVGSPDDRDDFSPLRRFPSRLVNRVWRGYGVGAVASTAGRLHGRGMTNMADTHRLPPLRLEFDHPELLVETADRSTFHAVVAQLVRAQLRAELYAPGGRNRRRRSRPGEQARGPAPRQRAHQDEPPRVGTPGTRGGRHGHHHGRGGCGGGCGRVVGRCAGCWSPSGRVGHGMIGRDAADRGVEGR